MLGPPGTGKSMLAQCIPGILPKMQPKEILECSTIASVAGKLANGKISRARPFAHSPPPLMLDSGDGRPVGFVVKE